MLVVGRLLDPEGREPGGLVLVGKKLRIEADAVGRFRLELPDDTTTLKLEVERDGATVARHELDLSRLTGELVLEVPPRPLPEETAVAVHLGEELRRRPSDGISDGLRLRAAELGLNERTVRLVDRTFDELDGLSDLGLRAVRGDADALERLRIGLEGEMPFDFRRDLGRFKPGPDVFGIDPCRVLPRSPWAVVGAALILDGPDGTAWAGRAVSALLRRAEPALRVSRALTGLDAGQVGSEPLTAALEFTQRLAEAGRGPTPVWELLDQASGHTGAPPDLGRGELRRELGGFDPGGFDPLGGLLGGGLLGGGRRGFEQVLLDPCNLEWLECAHTFVTGLPPRPPDPPAVGDVQPTDILAGQPAQITLRPPTGERFPNVQDPGWTIQLGNSLIVPSTWDDQHIVLDVPALPPGCYRLEWWIDVSAGSDFFNQQSAACARFFGTRPQFPPFIPKPIDSISAVGTPKVRSFTADNVSPKLSAEGCTPVAIAWDIDRLVCADTTATFQLEVKDDTGAVLYAGPDPSGATSVTTGDDRIYTLTAANTLGGAATPPLTATLEVERYQRLVSLSVTPPGLIKHGQTVTIEATISCPADDPAQVVVTSDHPDRLPGVTMTIPVGQTKISAQVKAGTACGRVTLSGSVTGVNLPPVTTQVVVHNPTLDALVGASLEQCDGGSVTVRVRCATTIASVGLVGPAGFVASNGAAQLTASVPSDPASGTVQARANFGPLAAGAYTVRVQADGVMIDAGQVTVTLGAPTVTLAVSPGQVQVCAGTQVTLTATARRATSLTLIRQNGTVIQPPTTQADPCGTLTATVMVAAADAETFKATASRAGVTAVNATASVGETSNVPTASSARIVNTMNRVTVTRPDGTTTQLEVTVYVYVVALKPDGTVSTTKVGAITSPSGAVTYTPKKCELFELWALRTDDPAEMQTFNWKFRSGIILGHPNFPAAQAVLQGN